MIKTTISEIIEASSAFAPIMDMSFNGKLSFQVARLARELNKEIVTFDQQKTKLVEQYGAREPNGQLVQDENGNYIISQDNIEVCKQKIEDMLKTEVEINAEYISEDLFNEVSLTPAQAMKISTFIK